MATPKLPLSPGGDMPAPLPTPTPMFEDIDDTRIRRISPLPSPAVVLDELPSSDFVRKNVRKHRLDVDSIIQGSDDRLIAIVGPCSIHDVEACREYAQRLAKLADELKKDLKVVMRVYFEKPRTTVGWKGLINDPKLDGTNDIARGLRIARTFLLEVNELGLAAAVEYLDTITPQYLADLVSWGAIGARTTESQVHRELASGLSCAIGFKNGTSGDLDIACDACLSAREPHSFLSVTKDGVVAIVHTAGNDKAHVILRGGSSGPNYDAESVDKARKAMLQRKLAPRIVVDCSHANSRTQENPKKDYKLQTVSCADVGRQIAGGETDIVGIMLESHLNEGNQSLNPGKTDLTTLKRGVSVTDGCIAWDATVECLRALAESVRQRRAALSTKRVKQ